MGLSKIINDILKGNEMHSSKARHYTDDVLRKQTPKVTLVLCSDSRIADGIFGFEKFNYAFCIRDIGNQILTAEGSVDYGVLHLKTPPLMIVGHTGCGAIKASLGDYSKETIGIRKELDSLKKTREGHFNGEELLKEARYSQKNVDAQVEYAVKKYKNLVDSGDLVVIGAMFDMHGVLSGKKGKIYITNINSEKDEKSIKSSDVFLGIEKGIVENSVRRI
ncbi:MAG: carbonic anhydrase [Candidatus Woesearchaeota archaeon]|nr:carbonic anhydrase [Candidatus Woesearchaeota archaeon]